MKLISFKIDQQVESNGEPHDFQWRQQQTVLQTSFVLPHEARESKFHGIHLSGIIYVGSLESDPI
jgi:hypothetical protein